ncbi:Gfo/Idh/MocA family oxidoreductase [Pendulispora albinea]|uniref:Gfo/Idh/MocA family oxidoreductase n=1 Tax=Pendulispora albinea TaxID=2741071 RepID=A0ABZ2M6X5_9BACT
MRIGLAGAGLIGSFHAQTLRQLPAVEELVIADANAERARQVAEALGAKALPRVDDLFESKLDGLVIAAATAAHPELLVRAIERGIPVFCEKPVAPTLHETLAVLERVQGARVPVQIGFQRRFDAGYIAAREAIRSGRLGWVHTLRACTLDEAPPPPEYVPTSGGIFRDCSIHDFDILRWVTGREIVHVHATGANRGDDYIRAAGDVDTMAAILTFDDGTLAVVSATMYNAKGYDVRLEALGSKDDICAGLDERTPLRSVEPGVRFPSGTPYPGFIERFRPAYQRELAVFLDVAARQVESPCSVADGLAAFLVAEACERARRERRMVRMEEVAP